MNNRIYLSAAGDDDPRPSLIDEAELLFAECIDDDEARAAWIAEEQPYPSRA